MFQINSYIRDIDTKEALPFASVMITDNKGKAALVNGYVVGRKADENGKVSIPIREDLIDIIPMTKPIVLGMGYSAQSMYTNLVSTVRQQRGTNQSYGTDNPATSKD